MAVSVQNIFKTYEKKEVLTNVSFSIPKGQIVGLLGENGAGKSTLMKIITGIETPTKGTVMLFEKTLFKDRLQIQKKIGYLPESNPLYDWMYLVEYLKFIADLHKLPHKNITYFMKKLGLYDHRNTKIAHLSKGYRQRLGLAATLIHNPEFLLLDEPFVGLDPLQLKELTGFIKEIAVGKIVLFSSHILEQVASLCDRVLVLKQGKMIADKKITDSDKNTLLEYLR